MTEQSKTPITDSNLKSKGSFSCVERSEDWNYVEPSLARSLELAANALAEKIRKAPHSDTCMSVLWNRRCDCWKSDALAEFEKLKNQQP